MTVVMEYKIIVGRYVVIMNKRHNAIEIHYFKIYGFEHYQLRRNCIFLKHIII